MKVAGEKNEHIQFHWSLYLDIHQYSNEFVSIDLKHKKVNTTKSSNIFNYANNGAWILKDYDDMHT